MTNKELASLLQISPATLSLVINNKPGISQKMRAHVTAQLQSLGYDHLLHHTEPKPAATRNICFVVYKRHGHILDDSPFILPYMEGVESCAHQMGYNIIFVTIDRRNPLEPQLQRLNTMDCAGAILYAVEMMSDDLDFFNGLSFPYVVLANYFLNLAVDTVATDNRLGTYQAIDFLHKMGHTNLGYLKSNVSNQTFQERDEGFAYALQEKKLPMDNRHIFHLNCTEHGSYSDFSELLSKGIDLPTAFFADDDSIAAGVINALTERGINVPNDISVIGYNDRPLCTTLTPALTTICIPRYSFGAAAVQLLLKRLDTPQNVAQQAVSIKYRIGTRLIVRDSVKALSLGS